MPFIVAILLVLNQGLHAMFRWLYILPHLLLEAGAARRDARIRFLKAEVEILRRKLGGNRVIPSPDDRARLLALGAELNHNVGDLIGIVTPQTYSRWVVEQVEERKPRNVGRPKLARNVRVLVTRLATENVGWGYRRIAGELRKLRLRVSRSSVRLILKDAGLTPSPTRRGRAGETTWRKFLRLHMNTLVACDFFTKAVVTPVGVKLAWCLVFIHVGTRKVFLSPATYHPHGKWAEQQARNVMMWLDDHQIKARFILRDRDTKFSSGFDQVFQNASIRRLRTPLLAPDANAFAEAWIGAIKRECLNHFLCFSLGHLDHIAQEYARFFNTHRPHQGLGNRTVAQAATRPPEDCLSMGTPDRGRIHCQRFLGGLLRHYYRAA
jgi:putative transposase